MLNVRHTRLLLYALTASCLLAAAAAVVWGLRPPAEAAAPLPTVRSVVEDASPAPSAPPLEAFQAAWRLDLHRPLLDPPPPPKVEPPKAEPPKPPAPLKLSLWGTNREDGREEEAMLLDSTGRMVVLRVGQSIEGATLQRIEAGQVQLQYHGQTHILKVPTQ